MTDLDKNVNGQVKCRTKKLENFTGVCNKDYEKGFLWDRIKERAMQNYNDDENIVMDLTEEEFEFIETYCLPNSKGKLTARLKLKNVCGFTGNQLS
jgi:hypothetical protein